MRFLVIGGGSMGRRRIRCLLAHSVDVSNIRLVEVREDRRIECKARHNVDSFPDIDRALAWAPDVFVISTPTRHHMEYCLRSASAGKDFFCEIALSHSLEGTEELVALVAKHNLVAALGIQTPFHPVVRQAREWLRDPSLGRPLIYHFEWGNYLPNWHPWERYTDFYDSTQIIGVLAEDLGQLYSFLDDRLVDVFCRFHRQGSLEIEGPDCIQFMGKTARGTVVTLQFDLLQDTQQTDYRIVCENGVVEVQLFPNCWARRRRNGTTCCEVYSAPKGYQYEQCYIDEFGAFLQALRDRTEWHHPLADAVGVLKCLVAADQSHREERVVRLDA